MEFLFLPILYNYPFRLKLQRSCFVDCCTLHNHFIARLGYEQNSHQGIQKNSPFSRSRALLPREFDISLTNKYSRGLDIIELMTGVFLQIIAR